MREREAAVAVAAVAEPLVHVNKLAFLSMLLKA